MIARTTLAFVFATPMEADPFIDLVNAVQIRSEPCLIYQAMLAGQPTIVVISGMGMCSAKTAMEFIVEHYPANTIFNCGVAGSLSDDYLVGDIVNITQSRTYQAGVIGKDICHISTHSSSLKGYTDGVLLTTDQPVFDWHKKKELSDVAQLVDMEGASIARICKQNNLSLQLVKIISDVAEDRSQLKTNLFDMSKVLADTLMLDLNKLFHRETTV